MSSVNSKPARDMGCSFLKAHGRSVAFQFGRSDVERQEIPRHRYSGKSEAQGPARNEKGSLAVSRLGRETASDGPANYFNPRSFIAFSRPSRVFSRPTRRA